MANLLDHEVFNPFGGNRLGRTVAPAGLLRIRATVVAIAAIALLGMRGAHDSIAGRAMEQTFEERTELVSGANTRRRKTVASRRRCNGYICLLA